MNDDNSDGNGNEKDYRDNNDDTNVGTGNNKRAENGQANGNNATTTPETKETDSTATTAKKAEPTTTDNKNNCDDRIKVCQTKAKIKLITCWKGLGVVDITVKRKPRS